MCCAGNAVFWCLHCALINNQECLKYSLLSMIPETHLPTGVHHFLWEGVVGCFFMKDRSGSATIVALSQSRKIVATCFAFALIVTWCVKVSKSFANGKCFVLRQKTQIKKMKIKIRMNKMMTKIKGKK